MDDISLMTDSPKKPKVNKNTTQVLDSSTTMSQITDQESNSRNNNTDYIDVSKTMAMPPSGNQRNKIIVIDHRTDEEKEQKVEAVRSLI
jgi:hypothetical protein